MITQVLIPVRAFEDGKQRLSPVLSQTDREALNKWFLKHTLSVVTEVVPPSSCIIISAAANILHDARALGFKTIHEQEPGDLCRSLSHGAQRAERQGVDAVLSLSCDLPFLAPEDLSALQAAAASGKVVIAPDEAQTGTNALLVSPPCAIPYLYGKASLAAHVKAAEEAGLSVQRIDRPGLARDVDTLQDLEACLGLASCWPALSRFRHDNSGSAI